MTCKCYTPLFGTLSQLFSFYKVDQFLSDKKMEANDFYKAETAYTYKRGAKDTRWTVNS